jgi:DNA-binding XRE family transcriptional regulator
MGPDTSFPDAGYQEFKIGVALKIAREEAGLTQEQLAKKLNTKKTAISRIEGLLNRLLTTCQKVHINRLFLWFVKQP